MKLFKTQYLFLLVGCLVMCSCSNDEEAITEKDNLKDKYLWVIDEYGETEYAASFINGVNEYVAFFKTDEVGNVSKIDYLCNDGNSLVTVALNKDGLVESICGDSLTIVFSNYSGKKVDMAFVYKDEIAVVNDFETEFDWDDIASKSAIDSRAWYDGVEKFARPLYYVTEEFGLAISFGTGVGNLVKAGIKGEAATKMKDILGLWGMDLAIEYAESFEDVLSYEVANVNIVELDFDAYAIVGSFGNPVAMILNYSSYVDFFYAMFLWSAQVYDELSKEMASGALLRIAINSYEHTLPAMHNEGNVTFTLSTNVTYTQMESDVKEWGVALFKGNELIEKYPVESISESTQFINLSFKITKKQFDLDYDNYIATPKDEWYLKAYEINYQNPNIPIFGRSKTTLELVYNQKPSITIKDLEVGKTIDINEGNWDRATPISYKTLVTGSLFMEDYYEYFENDWIDEGKGNSLGLFDTSSLRSKQWVMFSSEHSADTSYFYYIGIVNGKQMRSANYMKFEQAGKNCTISLVDGTVDSRASRSVDDKAGAFECGSDLIERGETVLE